MEILAMLSLVMLLGVTSALGVLAVKDAGNNIKLFVALLSTLASALILFDCIICIRAIFS